MVHFYVDCQSKIKIKISLNYLRINYFYCIFSILSIWIQIIRRRYSLSLISIFFAIQLVLSPHTQSFVVKYFVACSSNATAVGRHS